METRDAFSLPPLAISVGDGDGTGVKDFMDGLDIEIERQLTVLRDAGASRHGELCQWALGQCVEAGERQPIIPIDITPEAATVARLWSRIEPKVLAGRDRINSIDWLEIARAEDGRTIIMFAEVDNIDISLELELYASEQFFAHFNPTIWEAALAGIASTLGDAEVEVLDWYADRLTNPDTPGSGWSRIW